MQQAAASPNFVEPILLPIADCIEVAICQPLPTHTRHIGTYNPTFFFYKQNFFFGIKSKAEQDVLKLVLLPIIKYYFLILNEILIFKEILIAFKIGIVKCVVFFSRIRLDNQKLLVAGSEAILQVK